MIQKTIKTFALAVGLIWISTLIPAAAEGLSAADKARFQSIISAQITAFRKDNADAAFAFASPRIQQVFRDPSVFMTMVKQTYRPVYRPKYFEFGLAELKQGTPTQIVSILGPNGIPWSALYTFERQKDNSWRISGVYLLKQKGFEA